jgi:hypothetical protein
VIDDFRGRPLGRVGDAGLGAGPNFGGLPLGLEVEAMNRPRGLTDFRLGREDDAGLEAESPFKGVALVLVGARLVLGVISRDLACEGWIEFRIGLAVTNRFLASSRADRAGVSRNLCLAFSRADRAGELSTIRLTTIGDLAGAAISVVFRRCPVESFSGESRQTTCGSAMTFLAEVNGFLLSRSTACFVIFVFGSRVPRARRGTTSASGVVSRDMMSQETGTAAVTVDPIAMSLSGR